MANCYGLTAEPLPKPLHGADADYSIRTLSDRERISIEDYFLKKDIKVSLKAETTAVIVPLAHVTGADLEDFAILVEFALGILSVSGFQPIMTAATLSDANCSEALRRSYQEAAELPTFPKRLVKAAASTWMRHFFAARRKTTDKLHI